MHHDRRPLTRTTRALAAAALTVLVAAGCSGRGPTGEGALAPTPTLAQAPAPSNPTRLGDAGGMEDPPNRPRVLDDAQRTALEARTVDTAVLGPLVAREVAGRTRPSGGGAVFGDPAAGSSDAAGSDAAGSGAPGSDASGSGPGATTAGGGEVVVADRDFVDDITVQPGAYGDVARQLVDTAVASSWTRRARAGSGDGCEVRVWQLRDSASAEALDTALTGPTERHEASRALGGAVPSWLRGYSYRRMHPDDTLVYSGYLRAGDTLAEVACDGLAADAATLVAVASAQRDAMGTAGP